MMIKHFKSAVQILITALFLLTLIALVNYVLKPKYLYGDGFPTTATFKGFYETAKNTQEVIFLGSSHGATGFNPEVLMNEYAIESYNLSCEQQNLFTSYYWLKEALKTQNPETVVLETSMLFLFTDEELAPKNANCTRKAFDFMRLSPNKLEAMVNASAVSKELGITSFILPNTVYHTRWKELSKKDFTVKVSDLPGFSKGFYALSGSGVEGYAPIEAEGSDEFENYDNLMYNYLTKIVDLCREKNIRLILVSTPSTLETRERFNTLSRIAQILDTELIDFNDASVYNASGYDFYNDNNDDDHANESGAAKITSYLGKIITQQ